jgi:hypothetical protein
MNRQLRKVVSASAKEALGNEAAAVPVEHYTRKEIAILAKICVHTVARDVRAGRLKEIRHNRRRLRYHPDAVKEYLAGFYGVSISDKPRLQPTRPATPAGGRAKPKIVQYDGLDASKSELAKAPNSAVSGAKSATFLAKSQKHTPEGSSEPIMKFFGNFWN